MALPDYIEVTQGTAIIWGEAGASGVTATLSFDALANSAARMGAKVDLGANYAEEYLLTLRIETGTAPTAGSGVELYMACSHDDSVYPGGVTGSDAAYTLGTSDINLKRLGAPSTVLIASADATTTLTQAPVIWRPKGRYVAPVIVNRLGQAIRDEATATNNDSRIYLIPRRFVINE